MYPTTFIKRFINLLPKDKIFTTRQVLTCGTRSAVDKALSRLVKSGRIERLARGVFIKEGSKRPSAFEVAQAKYQAFYKKIAEHGADLAARLGLMAKKEQPITFTTIGRSSSFWFDNKLIRIKGISPRKMQLNEDKVGQYIAAACYMGKNLCKPTLIEKINQALNRRDENLQLKLSRPLMPEWLGCHFVSRSYINPNDVAVFKIN